MIEGMTLLGLEGTKRVEGMTLLGLEGTKRVEGMTLQGLEGTKRGLRELTLVILQMCCSGSSQRLQSNRL